MPTEMETTDHSIDSQATSRRAWVATRFPIEGFLLRVGLLFCVSISLGTFATADEPVRNSWEANGAQTGSPEITEPVRVLIDAYHAHTWIDTLATPGQTNYHLLNGPARAVQSLRAMGWDCDVQLGPWTTESLSSVNLIVINLVSADRPPFLVEEIQALMAFLRQGGGAIIITDHTNCYFHNHVLGAWFHELELQLTNHMACDRPPHTFSSTNSWINIESFSDHPVVQGLQNVGFLAGGSVDPKGAIAWTSPDGWADEGRNPPYGEGTSMGFYGDNKRQPGEWNGAIPVIAAKQIGEGRVVVLGDQNCIGSLFLNYADNRRLWIQAAQWTARANPPTEKLHESLRLGLDKEPDRTLIWCLEPLDEHRYYWGQASDEGFFHMFAFLNKHADARATNRPLEHASWLIVPSTTLLSQATTSRCISEFLDKPDHSVIVLGAQLEPVVAKDLIWESWLALQKVNPLANKPPQVDGAYQTSSGSHLFWIARGQAWSNRQTPPPDKPRNEADERLDEQKIEWMRPFGLKTVPSLLDQILWPDK